MTVKDLLKKLKALPPEAVVFCAADEEGNGYGELVGVEKSTVGDVRTCAYTRQSKVHGPDTPAVVLWPM